MTNKKNREKSLGVVRFNHSGKLLYNRALKTLRQISDVPGNKGNKHFQLNFNKICAKRINN